MREHVANLENTRRLLDLRGEAIVLAIVTAVDERLWDLDSKCSCLVNKHLWIVL